MLAQIFVAITNIAGADDIIPICAAVGQEKWVQFKVRVIPELLYALRIQNFEKAATNSTNFTKGFIFTCAWPEGAGPCAGIGGFVKSVAF
jgi:hypothetical protein